MTNNQILIKDAKLVNEGKISRKDLRIKNGRIERISNEINAREGDKVINADRYYLMPGMIDDQVHFRDPGLTYKGDLITESQAAVMGGITSFMDMPNTNPQVTTIDKLEEKYLYAKDRCVANYAFYMGTTNNNLKEIRSLQPGQTCGIKVFMGASTGNMLVDDLGILDLLFRDTPLLIAIHCEDMSIISANEKIAREKYGNNVPMWMHPLIRTEESCFRSSSIAIDLAKKNDTRIHILHLSSAKEMDLFQSGPVLNKRITAEVCVHHLYFDSNDYIKKKGYIKCNPAIKNSKDRIALYAALADDRLDVIATDHAPHTIQEKENNYFQVLPGLPLVQYALPMALELYYNSILSLENIVRKCAHAPAELFRICDRGFLREGYWADLVLVDLNKQQEIHRNNIKYKCGWSPLEGNILHSSIFMTIVNGEIVYDSKTLSDKRVGQRLLFKEE